MMKKPTIAFLGMGRMGGPMAANLARVGYEVHVWNRTPGKQSAKDAEAAGCHIVTTVADAVSHADYIFLCVSDESAVNEILFGDNGVTSHARVGTLIIDSSTITPEATIVFERQLQTYGLRMIDAPVSGGDVGAKQGTLTIMAAGNHEDFKEAHPLFTAIGKNVFYCGSVGKGQATKLCNQALCAIHAIAIGEVICLARRLGLVPEKVVEICQTGSAGSWALGNLAPRALRGDIESGFAVSLMRKDLRLIRESGGVLPGIELADKLFESVESKVDPSIAGTQSLFLAYENEDDLL